MSAPFEKLLKQAIKTQCNLIQLENESSGYEIYLISENSGFPANLTKKELNAVIDFVFKTKRTNGLIFYTIGNVDYKIRVKYRSDFGEQVFTLKILTKTMTNNDQ